MLAIGNALALAGGLTVTEGIVSSKNRSLTATSDITGRSENLSGLIQTCLLYTSVAMASQGQYGVPEGLQFGFPVRADGRGACSVVDGLARDEFATDRVRLTTEELESERRDVRGLDLVD